MVAFVGCGNTATQASAPAETKAAAPAETKAAAPAETQAAAPAETKAAGTDKENKDITSVMVAKHEGISWFDDMRIGVDQFAADTGVNAYQIAPEGGDPAKQLQMVEDLITQGVDAICVVPNDAKSMAPTLQKARDAGIVVIGHEAPDILDSVDYDLSACLLYTSGEHIADVILGEQHMGAFLVNFRLVVFHPEDFCRGKASH